MTPHDGAGTCRQLHGRSPPTLMQTGQGPCKPWPVSLSSARHAWTSFARTMDGSRTSQWLVSQRESCRASAATLTKGPAGCLPLSPAGPSTSNSWTSPSRADVRRVPQIHGRLDPDRIVAVRVTDGLLLADGQSGHPLTAAMRLSAVMLSPEATPKRQSSTISRFTIAGPWLALAYENIGC
jgi:hypothetical protein